MKMKLTRTIVSLGLMMAASVAINAQTIPDIGGLANVNQNGNADGDLVLGFSNTVSSTNDLLVDIGPADFYYSTTNPLGSQNPNGALTPGTPYTVLAYNSSDLSTVFGANANSSNTRWAVIGGNGNAGGPGTEPNDTLWASSAGAVFSRASAVAQGTFSAKIDGFT